MAVEDKYVGPEFTGSAAATQYIAPGTRPPASRSKGAKLLAFCQTFELVAADDNGTVLRLFKGLPSSLKPYRCTVMCDTVTGGTDYNLGFYITDGGAEAPTNGSNVLADAIDLSTASKTIDGLEQMAIEDRGIKSIADLLGVSVEAGTDKGFYDLALTAVAIGSAAVTVTVHFEAICED